MAHVRIVYWLMWILTELFFAYQFILRVSAGVFLEDIMQKFHISATYFGLLSAVYYFGYAGMQIPVGILLDRYGPRIVVMASALICTIGNLIFVCSDYWPLALVARFLIGLGSTAGFLGATKTVTMWFNPRAFTLMMSVTFAIGYLGAIIGSKPIAILVEKYGWENILFGFSLVGLLIVICTLSLKNLSKAKENYTGSVKQEILSVLKKPQIILVCICAALQVGPLEAFADIWGISYFHKVHNIKIADAAFLTSSIYFGLCVGGPCIAYFAEKYKCYYGFCASSGAVMACIYLLLLFGLTPNYSILLLLMFIVGICSGYQIIAFTITARLVPPQLNGMVTSVTNMIIMSAGSFFHFIIGKVMDLFWSGKMEGHLHIYSSEAYTNSLFILPITLIMGCVGFMWLKPKSY